MKIKFYSLIFSSLFFIFINCNNSLAANINLQSDFKFSPGECVLKPDGFIWKVSRISDDAYITQGYFEFCPNSWSWGNEVALEKDVVESEGSSNITCPSIIRGDTSAALPADHICAENGSCYGDISAITGKPKSVYVKGYYRQDGTYVRSHFRSSH